jgi:hypothetical protein
MFQYDIREYVPEYYTPFALMFLPAVVFYVWWFVVQSWYNVDKNYGKLTFKQDYINFFIYWFITIVIYSTIVVIPHTLNLKVKMAVDIDELKKDIDKVRSYSVYFDNYEAEYNIQIINNKFEVKRASAIDWDGVARGNNYYDYGYFQFEEIGKSETLTEKQVTEELLDFETLSKKYFGPGESFEFLPQFHIEELKNGNSLGYYYWDLEQKMETLYFTYYNHSGFPFYNLDYLLAVLCVTGLLAMLVWIFKNVHWKNFVATAVVFVVTPFLMGIAALIIFEVFNLRSVNAEVATLVIIMILHITALVLTFKPWLEQKHSSIGVISAIVLQIWHPFLVLIYYFMIQDIRDVHLYYPHQYDMLYFLIGVAFFVSLATLPIFKAYYKRMWALPKNK